MLHVMLYSVLPCLGGLTLWSLEMIPDSWGGGWGGGEGIHKTMGKHFWDAKLQTAGHPTEIDTLGLKPTSTKQPPPSSTNSFKRLMPHA